MILLMMTDGRKSYFEETLNSALENLVTDQLFIVVNDDSASSSFSNFLHNLLTQTGKDFFLSPSVPSKSGFGGAISNAWNHILNLDLKDEYVFHLEEDFTFNKKINISDLQKILHMNPHIQQVALRRQPWNEIEAAAGGIVESKRDSYTEKSSDGLTWLEHRVFFTTNPCLYRKSLCLRGWPVVDFSEGIFSRRLFDEDSEFCSAYFGSFDSGEMVRHIGFERTGHGY